MHNGNSARKKVSGALVVNEILKWLVFGSMVGSVIIAPNAVQAAEKALRFLDKRDRKLRAKAAFYYMKRQKLIDYKILPDGSMEVKVTKKGRLRAEKVNFTELSIPRPKQWDKKWRLVLFDIPEKQRSSRESLSRKLKSLGFYQLQRSAWVHPYPCNREIEIVKQVFGIPDTNILKAELTKIDHQKLLKKQFKSI